MQLNHTSSLLFLLQPGHLSSLNSLFLVHHAQLVHVAIGGGGVNAVMHFHYKDNF